MPPAIKIGLVVDKRFDPELKRSEPSLSVVPPVYVLVPLRIHLPDPCFSTAVVFREELFTMTAEISPIPEEDPCRVSVLEPAPVDVNEPLPLNPVNFKSPVPE